jgi:hypothetical protein
MSDAKQCEYCGRPIKGEPTKKTLRGKKHTFCSEFCFRLYFYKIPGMSYEDLRKMYAVRCVSIKAPADLRELIRKEG